MLEFDEKGKLKRRKGRPRKINPSRRTIYAVNDPCLVKGLRAYPLKGIIVSLEPLQAKVTDEDMVFEGTITTDGIRKAKGAPNVKG